MATLRSDGEDHASAYVESDVPPSRPEPVLEIERVTYVDPRRAPTLRLNDGARGSGPRNPDQTTPPREDEPRIELPDGLPLTAPQQVFVPPELAAKWREEAKRKGTS